MGRLYRRLRKGQMWIGDRERGRETKREGVGGRNGEEPVMQPERTRREDAVAKFVGKGSRPRS